MSAEKIYACDPEKNKMCQKTDCKYRHLLNLCYCTTHKEFAKVDKNGNPVVIFEIEEEKEKLDRELGEHVRETIEKLEDAIGKEE